MNSFIGDTVVIISAFTMNNSKAKKKLKLKKKKIVQPINKSGTMYNFKWFELLHLLAKYTEVYLCVDIDSKKKQQKNVI